MKFFFELYLVVLYPFMNSTSWILLLRSALFYSFIMSNLVSVSLSVNPLKKIKRKRLLSLEKKLLTKNLWYRLHCCIDSLILLPWNSDFNGACFFFFLFWRVKRKALRWQSFPILYKNIKTFTLLKIVKNSCICFFFVTINKHSWYKLEIQYVKRIL